MGLMMAVTMILYWLKVRDGAARATDGMGDTGSPSPAAQKVPDPRDTVLPRNGSPSTSVTPSAFVDQRILDEAEQLLKQSESEYSIVYEILTNSGIPADSAKIHLRTMMAHLSFIAGCERYLATSESDYYAQSDAIRDDPSIPVQGRSMMLVTLAANREAIRNHWLEKIMDRMGQLRHLIAEIQPELADELQQALLRVQPVSPP
jgi:hypothetical protein